MQGAEPALSNVVNTSARGATYLILVQVLSRGLTFVINQVLLRFLSPDLLGAANQLELFAVSVLYFSRESLRVALQRSFQADRGSKGAAAEQAVTNLAYIAILLGQPLAGFFAWLYLRTVSSAALRLPCSRESLVIYALACSIELLVEPSFAVTQRRLLYGLRARAETVATLTRCFLTCGFAAWANRRGLDVGTLPFAAGQMAFALALGIVYLSGLWTQTPRPSLAPARSPDGDAYWGYWPKQTVGLAASFYAQAGLKHILTQGDSLLTTLFATLSSQGIFALASSYGSLLARLVFQPIEESSRSVFGRLLPTSPKASDLDAAHGYLLTVLRAYALLSLQIVTVGPTVAPLLLRLIAGSRWAQSDAPKVLGVYCYYIPFLAFNGVLEAFVSAVATVKQIRSQSAWMLAFSAGYAGAGYMLLQVYDLGAPGLVAANCVNMAARIAWCSSFIRRYWTSHGKRFDPLSVVPSMGTMASSVGCLAGLHYWSSHLQLDIVGLMKTLVICSGYGVTSYGLPETRVRM